MLPFFLRGVTTCASKLTEDEGIGVGDTEKSVEGFLVGVALGVRVGARVFARLG